MSTEDNQADFNSQTYNAKVSVSDRSVECPSCFILTAAPRRHLYGLHCLPRAEAVAGTWRETQVQPTRERLGIATRAGTSESFVLSPNGSSNAANNYVTAMYTSPPLGLGQVTALVSGALPVTLLSFVVHREGTAAVLRWQTTSEGNADRFEVERSSDGHSLASIGTVPSQSALTHSTYYTCTDNIPMVGRSTARSSITASE